MGIIASLSIEDKFILEAIPFALSLDYFNIIYERWKLSVQAVYS